MMSQEKPNISGQRLIQFKIEEGILIGVYEANLDIDFEKAKIITQSRLDFIQGKSYPSLLDGRGLKSINREAREYFSSKESYKGVVAAALLADSIFTSYIGNFFLKITNTKSKVPMRLFNDEKKAKKWLKQFVIKDE